MKKVCIINLIRSVITGTLSILACALIINSYINNYDYFLLRILNGLIFLSEPNFVLALKIIELTLINLFGTAFGVGIVLGICSAYLHKDGVPNKKGQYDSEMFYNGLGLSFVFSTFVMGIASFVSLLVVNYNIFNDMWIFDFRWEMYYALGFGFVVSQCAYYGIVGYNYSSNTCYNCKYIFCLDKPKVVDTSSYTETKTAPVHIGTSTIYDGDGNTIDTIDHGYINQSYVVTHTVDTYRQKCKICKHEKEWKKER